MLSHPGMLLESLAGLLVRRDGACRVQVQQVLQHKLLSFGARDPTAGIDPACQQDGYIFWQCRPLRAGLQSQPLRLDALSKCIRCHEIWYDRWLCRAILEGEARKSRCTQDARLH